MFYMIYDENMGQVLTDWVEMSPAAPCPAESYDRLSQWAFAPPVDSLVVQQWDSSVVDYSARFTTLEEAQEVARKLDDTFRDNNELVDFAIVKINFKPVEVCTSALTAHTWKRNWIPS